MSSPHDSYNIDLYHFFNLQANVSTSRDAVVNRWYRSKVLCISRFFKTDGTDFVWR